MVTFDLYAPIGIELYLEMSVELHNADENQNDDGHHKHEYHFELHLLWAMNSLFGHILTSFIFTPVANTILAGNP